MMEPVTALIGVRAATYAAAVTLFGASLLLAMFASNSLAAPVRARLAPLLRGAAMALLAASIATLPLQAAIAGEGWGDAMSSSVVTSLVRETWTGQVALARVVLAGLIVLAQGFPRGGTRIALARTGLLAGLFIASFALTGHAAMHEGVLGLAHRLNHVVHVLAGSFWLGALLPLAFAARAAARPHDHANAVRMLKGFSTAGMAAVTTVAATGVANTALILGKVPGDFTSPYQVLLAAKIVAVLGMLALAAGNRFWLLPRLSAPGSTNALRASVLAECVLGALVLGLVATFGTMEPV